MIFKELLHEPTILNLVIFTKEDSFTVISSTSIFHSITLPSFEFEYSVYMEGERVKSGRIVPPGSVKDGFSFGVYGDPRYGRSVHEEIVERLRKLPFVFILGDIVSNGLNVSEWYESLSVISKLEGIVFTARGNHDSGPLYNLYLYPDEYSVRIGNLRFLILDSNSIFFLKNLENTLKRYSEESTTKIAMFHHVVFSCGPHGKDLDTLLRRRAHDILKRYGVRIVITSHDHNYQRLEKDGITYVVTGGGGAALYDLKTGNCGARLVKGCVCHNYLIGEVRDDLILFKVFDIEGKIVDEFRITSKEGEGR